MGAVALDLLVRRNCAEDDFSELPFIEGPVGDAAVGVSHSADTGDKETIPDYFQRLLDNGNAQMGAVIHETGYVVLGHLGQLFLEDALEAGENDGALSAPVVVDDAEFNFTIALLNDRRLLGKGDNTLDGRSSVLVGRRRRGGRSGGLLHAFGRGVGAIGGCFALGWRKTDSAVSMAASRRTRPLTVFHCARHVGCRLAARRRGKFPVIHGGRGEGTDAARLDAKPVGERPAMQCTSWRRCSGSRDSCFHCHHCALLHTCRAHS